MDENSDKYLIKLCDSREQTQLDLLKEKLTEFPKFFFDSRSSTLLIYDRTCIFILSKDETKLTDLGRVHLISQMAYNPIRNILIFLTVEGELYGHFISHKTQVVLKRHMKGDILFGWVYGRESVDLFIAQHSGVKMIKVEDDKRSFKEMKFVSAKYNSFLYEPSTQVLAGFPVGDCKTVYTFNFDDDAKSKNWFKGPQVAISFDHDEDLKAHVKKFKSLGIRNSHLHHELFAKAKQEDHAAQLIKMNNRSYLVLYFSNEGKLKLYPIAEEPEKEISIKLPSDSVPIFHVVDNMLVIHLKNEKITFIYDVSNGGAQMLVSPFPLDHTTRSGGSFYEGSFQGRRHIMPSGVMSKWIVNIPVIYFYLKNETQIFEFLIRRREAKAELLRWLRENLLRIKQVNLSRFWKSIFYKYLAPEADERDNINLVQIYANIFYTLANDDLTPRAAILSIILECVRQANQLKIKIPYELQKLIFELLLETQKYETLVFLCHNDIIKDSEEFANILIEKGRAQSEDILITLAIDMANRACKHQKVFELLLLSQKVWEARRYLKLNFENIEVLFMIYAAKLIRDERQKAEYIKLTKLFIQKKFPSITEKYLQEAEESVRVKVVPEGPSFTRQSLR